MVSLIIPSGKYKNENTRALVNQITSAVADIEVLAFEDNENLIATFKAQKARGVQRILVGGGDGTLHHAVKSMLNVPLASRLPLGIVPLGTANDFANAAAFGSEDLLAGVKHSLVADTHMVDVAFMNDHPFINVASGGYVTKTTSEAPQPLKNILGRFAYYVQALAQVRDLPEYRLKIAAGDRCFDERCIAFAVANGATAGGGLVVGPRARINDGAIDLLVVPNQTLIELAALAAELLNEQPDLSKHQLFYLQRPEFIIESHEPVCVNLDGEPFKEQRLHFRVEPRCLEMIVSTDLLR